jgi:hypothetical protein
VGYLEVEVVKSLREDVVGGLHFPVVSLREGEVEQEETRIEAAPPVKEAGLEKIRVKNLNFFSCMDATNQSWEFMPYNFQSKLRSKYSDH